MSTVTVRDAEGDAPIRIRMSSGEGKGHSDIWLEQDEADQLTAQLIERQLNRWRDPDTDGPTEATSGVATGLRAALAFLAIQHGQDDAENMTEALLEIWADIPEEHARHITAAGWSVN